MSIITKRGDDGETDVMYGGHIPKNSPSIIAGGDVDELTSVLGLVRVTSIPKEIDEKIDQIQQHLIHLMGLVSVPAEKREKYLSDGYPTIDMEEVVWLEELAAQMKVEFSDWAKPGAKGSEAGARLDHARTVCRRAERSLWSISPEIPKELCLFLNRLSDVLWLWAREMEA